MTTEAVTTKRTPLERAFAPLAGLTSLFILCQAVTAGEFVSQDDRDGWIMIHDMVGYVTLLLAIATAVVGVIAFRKTSVALVWGSVVLAVLVVVQTVIGHLVTDLEQDGWIGVHVPLALVVFGITIWLAIRSAAQARAAR
ncbi:hypothetical protein BH11ACT4_BH11ACT4_17430 [soil metagenome]